MNDLKGNTNLPSTQPKPAAPFCPSSPPAPPGDATAGDAIILEAKALATAATDGQVSDCYTQGHLAELAVQFAARIAADARERERADRIEAAAKLVMLNTAKSSAVMVAVSIVEDVALDALRSALAAPRPTAAEGQEGGKHGAE